MLLQQNKFLFYLEVLVTINFYSRVSCPLNFSEVFLTCHTHAISKATNLLLLIGRWPKKKLQQYSFKPILNTSRNGKNTVQQEFLYTQLRYRFTDKDFVLGTNQIFFLINSLKKISQGITAIQLKKNWLENPI